VVERKIEVAGAAVGEPVDPLHAAASMATASRTAEATRRVADTSASLGGAGLGRPGTEVLTRP
jgi:hypothetical protein